MKRFWMVFLVFFTACVLLPAAHVQAASVQDELKITIDKILDILRDPALKGQDFSGERRTLIRNVIKEKFSFEKMSQLTLARHWKKRSDAEKKIFIDLFGQLLEQTYIGKVETYTDERVVFVKEYVKKNKAQVSTKIITDTLEIPIDYRLYQKKDGAWMVYDLVIEGVSLVGNYRSQFDQILQKNSYDTLVEELKKKVNP